MHFGVWLEKHARTLLMIVGVLMVLAGASWWIFFYEARYTLAPTPSSATVTVDGAMVAGGERIKLKPGQHTITVSLNDFIPLSQTLQVKSGQYVTVPLILRSVPHLQTATRDQVTGVAIEPTTNAIRYVNRTKQQAEQITLATGKPVTPVALSPAGSLPNIDEWQWAPTLDLGLFRSSGRWTLYDFQRSDLVHQSTVAWPEGVGSVSWKPFSKNGAGTTALVHYNAPAGGEQTLIETDPLHSANDRLADLRGSGVNTPTVAWVGAGDDVVLLSKDGRLWRFVVYTRSLTAITQSEAVDGFVVSPNGQTILAHSTNGQLFTIGIDGKNKRELKEPGSISGAAWAPDSSAVWLANATEAFTVKRIVIATDSTSTYATPTGESVGRLNQTLITADEKMLVLAGERGIATLTLTPTDYPEIVTK